MKYFAIFLVAALTAQAFAQKVKPGENTKETLDLAGEYQSKAINLQNDINDHIKVMRQTVTDVLQRNMEHTIGKTSGDSNEVLKTFGAISNRMSKLNRDECYEDLEELVESIVKVTGFKISNILEAHDASVTQALANTESIIREYDQMSTSALRTVHKSFIKSNIFKRPQAVSDKFIAEFNKDNAKWQEIRPQIDSIINDLKENFNKNLVALDGNYANMLKVLGQSFDLFETEAVTVCMEYSGVIAIETTTGEPLSTTFDWQETTVAAVRAKRFAPRGKPSFFNHEYFVPKFEA